MRLRHSILAATLGAASAAIGADWLTDGADQQRTNWQRDEKILSKDNAKNIKLLWNIQLDNKPREMHALMPTLIASNVPTSSGPKEMALVAGAGDNLYGIDVKAGKVVWKKHFDFVNGTQIEGRGPLCPGGLLATPTIGEADARGARPAYAISGDGMMHFINVGDGEDLAPPAKFMPPNGKPYSLNLREGVHANQEKQARRHLLAHLE